MKHSKKNIIAVIILFILIFFLIIKFESIKQRLIIIKNDIISLFQSNKISKEIINKRLKYINEYYQTEKLLLSYEKKENVILSLSNNTNQKIMLNTEDLFYHEDLIKEKISFLKSDNDEIKIIKIFNFIQNNSYHSYPIFESHELHNPQTYFSLYGSGFCDDVAKNFYILATQFGYRSRVWSLNGHIVSDVFYHDNWHVIDPDWQGIVWYENEIASMEQMVHLAQKNALKMGLNKLYKSTHDNSYKEYPFLVKQKSPVVSLTFQANENKYFLNEAFILPTDGNYLSELNPSGFFNQYKGMSNIIYEIPLQQVMLKSNKIKINSFFPICGIYIKTNNTTNSQPVKIQLDTENRILKPYCKGLGLNVNGIHYRDYSYICRNLENYPTRQIVIKKNDNSINSTLLLISYYSYKNIQINNLNWKHELEKFNISYKKFKK